MKIVIVPKPGLIIIKQRNLVKCSQTQTKNRKSSPQQGNQRKLVRKTSPQQGNQRKASLDLAATRLVKNNFSVLKILSLVFEKLSAVPFLPDPWSWSDKWSQLRRSILGVLTWEFQLSCFDPTPPHWRLLPGEKKWKMAYGANQLS